jgi:hypothetical protein
VLSGLALLVIVFWALRRELPTAPAGPLLPAEPPPQLASTYTGSGTVSTFITVRLEQLGPGAGVRLTLIEQAGGAGGSTATYAGTIQGATVQAGGIDRRAQPPYRTNVVVRATSRREAVLSISEQDGRWDAGGHLHWQGWWRPVGAPIVLYAVQRPPAG